MGSVRDRREWRCRAASEWVVSAGAKRDGGFAPEQWPERIELHGKTFRAAKTTVDRQKAAADLLNAVSSMLRHEGLGSPTPEAAKAVSVIFSAFSKLSDGDQPELLKVWHVQGNPGDMPQRQRMKSLAAAWVEALVRFGEKKLSATSIVSDALTALGERAAAPVAPSPACPARSASGHREPWRR